MRTSIWRLCEYNKSAQYLTKWTEQDAKLWKEYIERNVYPFMIEKMKNYYWKLYSSNSPTLGMIWSLISHVEHRISNKLSSICQKKLLEKGPSILYGGYYAIAPLENHVGVYAPSIFAKRCRCWIWQKRLYDRIGQWLETLYKIWNVVS